MKRLHVYVVCFVVGLLFVIFSSQNSYADSIVRQSPVDIRGDGYYNVPFSLYPYFYDCIDPKAEHCTVGGHLYSFGQLFIPHSTEDNTFSGVNDYYSVNVFIPKSAIGKVLSIKVNLDFVDGNGADASDKVLRSYNGLSYISGFEFGGSNLKFDGLTCVKNSSGSCTSYYKEFMLYNSYYNSGNVANDVDEFILDLRDKSEDILRKSSSDSLYLEFGLSRSEGILKVHDGYYKKSQSLFSSVSQDDIYIGSNSYIEVSEFSGSDEDLQDSIEAHDKLTAKAIDDIENGYHSDGGESSIADDVFKQFNSIFDKIYKLFKFSVIDPFSYMWSMFSDDTCVDLPIIAGMLHVENPRYCSWWSPNIRSILTPVFGLGGTMLLWGFVVRWFKKESIV